MATIQFLLRDPNATTETPIHLVFYYFDIMIKVSTGKKIHPKDWDKGNRLAKETQRNKKYQNLNFDLRTFRNDILDTFENHQKRNKAVFINKLRQEFKDVILPKPVIEQEKMTFFKAIAAYVKDINRSTRTKLSYGTTLNTLTRYSNKMLKTELDFDNIGMDFYNDFQRYCYSTEKLALNTFGGYIKNIKVFMDYAIDKGYTTNTGHRHKNFQRSQETSDSIYLNDVELDTIYNHDFSNNPRLDRVRDLFIIACHTGLRYSDLSQLNENSITDGGSRFSLTTVKTGERVVIPLHWQVKAILQKWNGSPPKSISNQKLNKFLKDMGEETKFTENISSTITRGGVKETNIKKKWELITVHTARRSFATNMFLAGFPTISIMKITGHTSEKTFMKYIKISQEQNAEKIALHPRFYSINQQKQTI